MLNPSQEASNQTARQQKAKRLRIPLAGTPCLPPFKRREDVRGNKQKIENLLKLLGFHYDAALPVGCGC